MLSLRLATPRRQRRDATANWRTSTALPCFWPPMPRPTSPARPWRWTAASQPNEKLAMKALVYIGPNALALQEQPVPVPRPGELLVGVEAVGVCGSHMHAYHGHDARRPAPLVLGHEAAGRIAAGPRE